MFKAVCFPNNGKNADIHQSVGNSEEQLSITIKQGKTVCKYVRYRSTKMANQLIDRQLEIWNDIKGILLS